MSSTSFQCGAEYKRSSAHSGLGDYELARSRIFNVGKAPLRHRCLSARLPETKLATDNSLHSDVVHPFTKNPCILMSLNKEHFLD